MPAARGTVLVVDDDPAVRKALHRLIQAAGYRVESLADAAAYLARPPTPPPACMVLDIRMPGMNGLELQAAIAGTSRDLPIVFITGHGGEEMRSQALASGAVEVLFKPLDETTLLAAIEQGLSRSRAAAAGSGSGGSNGSVHHCLPRTARSPAISRSDTKAPKSPAARPAPIMRSTNSRGPIKRRPR